MAEFIGTPDFDKKRAIIFRCIFYAFLIQFYTNFHQLNFKNDHFLSNFELKISKIMAEFIGTPDFDKKRVIF